jgi:hypothetical protein
MTFLSGIATYLGISFACYLSERQRDVMARQTNALIKTLAKTINTKEDKLFTLSAEHILSMADLNKNDSGMDIGSKWVGISNSRHSRFINLYASPSVPSYSLKQSNQAKI